MAIRLRRTIARCGLGPLYSVLMVFPGALWRWPYSLKKVTDSLGSTISDCKCRGRRGLHHVWTLAIIWTLVCRQLAHQWEEQAETQWASSDDTWWPHLAPCKLRHAFLAPRLASIVVLAIALISWRLACPNSPPECTDNPWIPPHRRDKDVCVCVCDKQACLLFRVQS